MTLLILLSVLCTAGYGLLLYSYALYWKPDVSTGSNTSPLPFCSIVIAARNAETHITQCLKSVTAQAYPADRYEILVVNDGSDDKTEEQLMHFPSVRVLRTAAGMHGKKQALNTGIARARGEIIITTDADCIVQPYWLAAMVYRFTDTVQMVTGPVLLNQPGNAFERFQALDVAGLAMITASGIQSGFHHLANGANMAFRKSAFDAVGGFSGNTGYASGDDVFLVQSIAQSFPKSIRYAWSPDAFVHTEPCASLPAFMQQRLRWATKNKALREKSVFWSWAFIWTTFATNLTNLLISLFHGYVFMLAASVLIILIALIEYAFLRKGLRYFGQNGLTKGFVLSFLLHYFYVLYIGIAGAFTKKYQWKGRAVR